MKNTINSFRSFLYSIKLMWKFCKFPTLCLIMLKIILGLLPAATIWVSQELVNRVVSLISNNESLAFVIGLFLLQVLIMLSIFSFQQLSQYLNTKVSNVFELNISQLTFNKLREIQYINFEKPDFQDKLTRISSGKTQMLRMADSGLELFRSIISWISILIYLVSINWWFIPILFIGAIPTMIIQLRYGNKRYQLLRFLTPFGRKISYIEGLLMNRASLKEVRLYKLEKLLMEKWKEDFLVDSNENLNLQKRQMNWLILTQVFFVLTYAASGMLVIFLINNGSILIGSFVAVLQAIQRMQGGLNTISTSISNLYESGFQVNEYREFMERDVQGTASDAKEVGHINSITVKDLSFTYPDSTRAAIENINLTIEPGKKIAIIGANGSGKSTLIKCLSGLYDTDGSIFINGIPLEKINKNSYYKLISVLFQDYNKYEFTIKENINFGDIERHTNNNRVLFDRITEAAKQVNLDSYIDRLPLGYDTQLGRMFENGHDLSGGQWQRVAIARTIFRGSDLIILDEPTAALDPQSEVEIMKSLFEEATSKAIVYITHRLGATYLADEICVMKDGIIIERGTHQELINFSGEYQKMYEQHEKWKRIKNMEEVMQ